MVAGRLTAYGAWCWRIALDCIRATSRGAARSRGSSASSDPSLAARESLVTLITSHPASRRDGHGRGRHGVVRNPRRGTDCWGGGGGGGGARGGGGGGWGGLFLFPEEMAALPLTALEPAPRGHVRRRARVPFTDGALAGRGTAHPPLPAVYSVDGGDRAAVRSRTSAASCRINSATPQDDGLALAILPCAAADSGVERARRAAEERSYLRLDPGERFPAGTRAGRDDDLSAPAAGRYEPETRVGCWSSVSAAARIEEWERRGS